jgi:hypothetical protein
MGAVRSARRIGRGASLGAADLYWADPSALDD